MKKNFLLVIALIFVTVLVFADSNQDDSILEPVQQDIFINLVKVRIVMPDASEVLAVVPEGENLQITLGEELFLFSPIVMNLEQKSAIMENVAVSSDDWADKFQFEILDIVNTPISEIQPKCTCCITCDGGTTCASCVFACKRKCCCYPACCVEVE